LWNEGLAGGSRRGKKWIKEYGLITMVDSGGSTFRVIRHYDPRSAGGAPNAGKTRLQRVWIRCGLCKLTIIELYASKSSPIYGRTPWVYIAVYMDTSFGMLSLQLPPYGRQGKMVIGLTEWGSIECVGVLKFANTRRLATSRLQRRQIMEKLVR
jgi:hypothetical protein